MMSPGPDMILLLRNSTRYPGYLALWSVLGICVGLAFHTGLSILGLAVVIKNSPAAFRVIQTAGALYLFYIGIITLKTTADQTETETGNMNTGPFSAFQEGLICNLLNPKVTLFILSLFTQVIPVDLTFKEKLIIAVFLILEAGVVWSLFVWLVKVGSGQSFMQRYQLGISRLFGTALIILACTILIR